MITELVVWGMKIYPQLQTASLNISKRFAKNTMVAIFLREKQQGSLGNVTADTNHPKMQQRHRK